MVMGSLGSNNNIKTKEILKCQLVSTSEWFESASLATNCVPLVLLNKKKKKNCVPSNFIFCNAILELYIWNLFFFFPLCLVEVETKYYLCKYLFPFGINCSLCMWFELMFG